MRPVKILAGQVTRITVDRETGGTTQRVPVNKGDELPKGTIVYLTIAGPQPTNAGKDNRMSTVHLNHFVSATPRYDDTKFVETERDRAGFFRTPEEPVLALEISRGYFDGQASKGFSWNDNPSTINMGQSKMLRYKIVLSNLSAEQMEKLQYEGYEEDMCTNPQISQVLPVVEGLGAANFLNDDTLKYVSYDTLQDDFAEYNRYLSARQTWIDNGRPAGQEPKLENYNTKYAYFDWSYISTRDEGDRYAKNIDNAQPIWTYYVANMDEYDVDVALRFDEENNVWVKDIISSQSSSVPRLNNPKVNSDGADFRVQDKQGAVAEGSNVNRKFLTWHFTGAQSGGEVDNGVLQPGQAVIVELLVPFDENAETAVAESLLTTTGYGFKPGTYNPYLPSTSSDSTSTRGSDTDTRDVNLDGNTNQSQLSMQLRSLEFTTSTSVGQTKTVTTQLEKLKTEAKDGPSPVPEGSTYTYASSATNPDSKEQTSLFYTDVLLYDILPHENDNNAYNVEVDEVATVFTDAEKAADPDGSDASKWVSTTGGWYKKVIKQEIDLRSKRDSRFSTKTATSPIAT